MNKQVAVWIVGGLVTVSVSLLGMNPAIALAAEKNPQASPLQTEQMGTMLGKLDAKAMTEMMTSPEMQKQCIESMKSPEMQKAMKTMMKTPEMQAVMKQMLQQDMNFHQLMSDLVNSVDMNSEHAESQPSENPEGNASNNHSAHHG